MTVVSDSRKTRRTCIQRTEVHHRIDASSSTPPCADRQARSRPRNRSPYAHRERARGEDLTALVLGIRSRRFLQKTPIRDLRRVLRMQMRHRNTSLGRTADFFPIQTPLPARTFAIVTGPGSWLRGLLKLSDRLARNAQGLRYLSYRVALSRKPLNLFLHTHTRPRFAHHCSFAALSRIRVA